jgi:hypothetical protein
MSSLLKKTFCQAEKTFSNANKDSLANNLALLMKLVDGLELKDLVSGE